jgi:hypothetical protein
MRLYPLQRSALLLEVMFYDNKSSSTEPWLNRTAAKLPNVPGSQTLTLVSKATETEYDPDNRSDDDIAGPFRPCRGVCQVATPLRMCSCWVGLAQGMSKPAEKRSSIWRCALAVLVEALILDGLISVHFAER